VLVQQYAEKRELSAARLSEILILLTKLDATAKKGDCILKSPFFAS
jgi:hypothetical protein